MRPGARLAEEIVAELKAVDAEARRSNRALKRVLNKLDIEA